MTSGSAARGCELQPDCEASRRRRRPSVEDLYGSRMLLLRLREKGSMVSKESWRQWGEQRKFGYSGGIDSRLSRSLG